MRRILVVGILTFTALFAEASPRGKPKTHKIECPYGDDVIMIGDKTDKETTHGVFIFSTLNEVYRNVSDTAYKLVYYETDNKLEKDYGPKSHIILRGSILYSDGEPKDCTIVPMNARYEYYDVLDWFDYKDKDNCLLKKMCEILTEASRPGIQSIRRQFVRMFNWEYLNPTEPLAVQVQETTVPPYYEEGYPDATEPSDEPEWL